MHKKISSAALLASVMLLSGCAAIKNIGYIQSNLEQSGVADGMQRYAQDNVQLAVFRYGDRYYVHTGPSSDSVRWYDLDKADGIELSSGEFGFVSADVTFWSGGIEGLAHKPVIDKLLSFEKTDISQAAEFCTIPEYTENKFPYTGINLFRSENGIYYMFRDAGYRITETDGKKERVFCDECCVFLNGENIGNYDMNEYDMDDIISILKESEK